MKKLCCMLLCLLLLALGATALAEDDALEDIDIFTAEYILENQLYSGTIAGVQDIIWAGDMCYAYLVDMSVYTWQPGQEPAKLCVLPEAPASLYVAYESMSDADLAQLYETVTYIAANEEGLYGLNVYTGKFGTIDEEGIHWQDTRLDVDCLNPNGNFFPNRVARCFVTGDTLLTFVCESSTLGSEAYALYGFDLKTGDATAYPVQDAVGLCWMGDDAFLLLCQADDGYALRKLSLADGTVTDVDVSMDAFSASSVVGGIAYDADSDTIAFVSSGYVYVSTAGGAPSPMALVNTEYLMSETAGYLLPDGRYALYLEGLHVRQLSGETEKEDSRLTVKAPVLPDTLKSSFNSQYPETELTITYEQVTAEDVATMMTTQDSSVDVFELRADYFFSRLVDKGYAMPLSSSELIAQDVTSMDETIQAALTDAGGNILAYPSRLYYYYFSVNEGFWNLAFEGRELPTTLLEVMEAWLEWETDFADEYPELEFVDNYDYANYAREIISFYVMQHDMGTEMPDLTSGDLQTALELLSQINDIREQYGRHTTLLSMDDAEGIGYIFQFNVTRQMMNSPSTVLMSSSEEYLYDIYMYDATQLFLSFSEEDEAGVNGVLYVYIINPYTQHPEEALHFIECATAMDVNTYLYYAVHPDCSEPREVENFAQRVATYEEKILDLQSAMETAEASYRKDLEYQLEFYESYLEQQELTKWLISAETISAHRSMMNQLKLHLTSLYLVADDTSIDEMIASLCEQYCAGTMGTNQLLTQLQNKMRMIQLESE